MCCAARSVNVSASALVKGERVCSGQSSTAACPAVSWSRPTRRNPNPSVPAWRYLAGSRRTRSIGIFVNLAIDARLVTVGIDDRRGFFDRGAKGLDDLGMLLGESARRRVEDGLGAAELLKVAHRHLAGPRVLHACNKRFASQHGVDGARLQRVRSWSGNVTSTKLTLFGSTPSRSATCERPRAGRRRCRARRPSCPRSP